MIKLNTAQTLTSDTTILCSLYWKSVVCPTSPVRKSAFIKYLIEISQNNPHPENIISDIFKIDSISAGQYFSPWTIYFTPLHILQMI